MTICNESGDIQLVTCSVCGEPILVGFDGTAGLPGVRCEACAVELLPTVFCDLCHKEIKTAYVVYVGSGINCLTCATEGEIAPLSVHIGDRLLADTGDDEGE